MPDRSLNDDLLQDLLESIQNGRCVLFLGPQAALGPSGLPIEAELQPLIRQKLARNPPPKSRLSYLCQLADIIDARATVVRYFKGLETKKAVSPLHTNLAQLPFPLIIQTTSDPLMANALIAQEKEPLLEAYDFRASEALPNPASIGTEKQPLLYGLRGLWTVPRSVPLSADEEVSHFVALVREQPGLPRSLSDALRDNGKFQRSALFIGFEFAAWQTRLLLHALFATATTTVIGPSPAVSTPYLQPDKDKEEEFAWPPEPTEEDMEFLWDKYRIVFASHATTEFSGDLLNRWKEFRARAPQRVISREPNLSYLVKFIFNHIPEDALMDFAFNFPEFATDKFGAWQVKSKTDKARELVLWLNERRRLTMLLEWFRDSYPDVFAAEESNLFKA